MREETVMTIDTKLDPMWDDAPIDVSSEVNFIWSIANKYQTGFDQDKLCAMYVLKKLKGVNAVQTLSRLNRICPPYDKKTFVLDFVNSFEEITAAFAPYYTTTLLSNSVTPTAVYDLEAGIDAYYVVDPDDVEKFNGILYKGDIKRQVLGIFTEEIYQSLREG